MKQPFFNPHLGDFSDFFRKNNRLIHSLCRRYLVRLRQQKIDYQDLFQAACMGFYDAYCNYDPSYTNRSGEPVSFSTLAVPKIMGHIYRFFRDHPTHLRYPRKVKTLKKKVSKLLETQDSLSDEEIAAQLSCTVDDIKMARHFEQGAVSLQSLIYDDGNKPIPLESTIPYFQDFTGVELRHFLSTLTEQERTVVLLRMQGFTQMEIAKKLGKYQVQISRILQRVGKQYLSC